MAIIRRHWRGLVQTTLGLIIAAAAAIGALSYVSLTQAWGQAQQVSSTASDTTQTADALSPLAYSQIRQVRAKLCLTNWDLAAMGLSQDAATQVFTTLKQWQQRNQTALINARRAVLRAKAQLRDVLRKIHVGPRDQGVIDQVPSLKANLDAAKQQQLALINSAGTSVLASFTADQADLWQTLQKNRALPRQYQAAANLSDYQLQQLRRVQQAQVSEGAGGGESGGPSGGASLGDSQVLYLGQVSAVQEASDHVKTSMAGVMKAEQAVLPMPDALRQAVPGPGTVAVPGVPGDPVVPGDLGQPMGQ